MSVLTASPASDGRATPAAPMFRSTVAVITLIAVMVATVIAASLYVAHEQTSLTETRDRARLMRMTRQAMMEVNTLVVSAFATPGRKVDPVAYGRALAKLEGYGTSHLPATVKRGAAEVPSTAALASLRNAWDDMVAHLDAGERDAASEIHEMRGVGRDIAAFIAAFSSTLDGIEAEYAKIQSDIDRTIWGLLFGQIMVGVVSILSFLIAARRGARESAARALAVVRADSAREQVLRLFQMTDMLQSAGDYADANAVLRATVEDLLPDAGGALYVFSNSRDRLTLSTEWGAPGAEPRGDTIGLQQCWALKRGKPHISRPGGLGLCCEHCHGPDATLEIPMIARGEILGLLQISVSGHDAEARLDALKGVGSAVADAMSLALANLALRDKLRGQALRDPLTGLYNRRYMEDTLQRMVQLADRDRSELSVLMLDLDHFKRLNDHHGHARGDAALRDVAATMIASLRDSDIACRYGGEELLVILPHCGVEAAARKAEQLRASIEQLSEKDGAEISASFGVASLSPATRSVAELMAAADAALYRAKREGRNRVVCASSARTAQLALNAAE